MALLKKFWQAYKASEMPDYDKMKVGGMLIALFIIFGIIGFFIGVFSPLSIAAGIGWSELVLIAFLVAFRLFYLACRIYSAFTEVIHKKA
jgi:hypothetical protein